MNTALGAGMLQAPFDGAVVRWRLAIAEPGGTHTYKLRVLRPTGASSYTGAGTGPAQTAPLAGVNVLPLASPLPVQTGDEIGVDCPNGAPTPFSSPAPPGSTLAYFGSGLADGSTQLPTNTIAGDEELINADLVGQPRVTAVTPLSGPTAGGTPVTISGAHLGEVTGVSFGGVAASGVTPVFEGQVNALTPAHPAGVVDVRVMNAAGASPVVPGDAFTYLPPPSFPSPAPPIATIGSLSETNRTFAPAKGSTPLTGSTAKHHARGTTFLFTLDQSASVTVAIQRESFGRRVHRVCRLHTKKPHPGPRCTLYTTIATLTRTAHAGANQVPFTGTIRTRALKPGRYRAIFTAYDAAGAAAPRSIAFAIVAR
jgi:hypothetical protein